MHTFQQAHHPSVSAHSSVCFIQHAFYPASQRASQMRVHPCARETGSAALSAMASRFQPRLPHDMQLMGGSSVNSRGPINSPTTATLWEDSVLRERGSTTLDL